MGSVWCYSHKRMEEDTDYIDFPVSPTFLGGYYELGLTQRRPSEIVVRPPTPWEVSKMEAKYPVRDDDEYAQMFASVRDELKRLRAEIKELRGSPVQRKGAVEQRDIDVSSGD